MPFVQLSKVKIFYEREGIGIPLLMLQGIGAQLTLWPPKFCEALVNQGFELIKIDNRDSGLSSKLIDCGVPNTRSAIMKRIIGLPINPPYSLEDMSNDAVELMEQLGISQFHVLGISLGSTVAQLLSANEPDYVRSLTLMHSNTGKRRHMLIKPAALLKLISRGNVHDRAAHISGFIELFNEIGSPKYKRSIEEMTSFAGKAYDRSHHPPGFKRQLVAFLACGDRESYYKKISCPTAVIHGHIDPLMPLSAAKSLVDSIPKAKAHFFDDLAHDIPDHYAGMFAKIIKDTANESTC